MEEIDELLRKPAGKQTGAGQKRHAEQTPYSNLADELEPLGFYKYVAVEGCELGELAQTYDSRQGYTVTIGDERHTMWDESEAKRSWELTTTRTAALLNQRLERVGSEERVHLLHGGEDAVFVLLTAAMRELIAKSGVFRPEEVPSPVDLEERS